MPDLDLSLDDIRGGGVLAGIRPAPIVEEPVVPPTLEPPALPDASVEPSEGVGAAEPDDDERAPSGAETRPPRAGARRRPPASSSGGRRATAHSDPAPRRLDVLERATRQTSIALDPDLLGSLDTYRRALGESQNAVLVAVLRVGLPVGDEDAVDAMLTEKYEHQVRRVEQNVRLPLPLLDRVDELVAPAREQDRSLSRAHLVNAALRAGMPETVDAARKLMANQLKARISVARSAL